MPKPEVVAVINTSEDTTDLLRVAFERAGFVVVTVFTMYLRDGRIDFEAFVRQHQPDVIVWDIAIPYDHNWRLFEHFRDSPAARGIRFVVTTTNAAQVRKIADPAQSLHEIVGKPYDLEVLVRAVARAAAGDPPQRELQPDGTVQEEDTADAGGS